MSESTKKLAQSKLIILYLLYKMNVPMSNGQICQFTLDANYIEYFSLQKYLSEMLEGGLLSLNETNGKQRYSITTDGYEILSYFMDRIPSDIRENINNYVSKMLGEVKRDMEVSAAYYCNADNDYTVKCGIYENERTLLEISVSVVSKEQAKLICHNWKHDTNNMYLTILTTVMTEEEEITK